MSYESTIVKALSRFGKNGTEGPDVKHNIGRMLGDAFMWSAIAKYAKAKEDSIWKALEREEIIPDKKSLTPGDHQLADSPSFAVFAKVTQPVKTFSGDELAKLFSHSKYKVPESTTKEFVDQARVPTTSRVTLKVVERG